VCVWTILHSLSYIVSLLLYTYIYIYIYIYTYIYIYIYTYTYIYIYMCVLFARGSAKLGLYWHLTKYQRGHRPVAYRHFFWRCPRRGVPDYVSIDTTQNTNVGIRCSSTCFICTRVYIYIHILYVMYVYTYICVQKNIYIYIYIYTYIYIYVHIHIHMSMYLNMYVNTYL